MLVSMNWEWWRYQLEVRDQSSMRAWKVNVYKTHKVSPCIWHRSWIHLHYCSHFRSWLLCDWLESSWIWRLLCKPWIWFNILVPRLLFIVCVKKWANFEPCSKRKWIWSQVWYPGDREADTWGTVPDHNFISGSWTMKLCWYNLCVWALWLPAPGNTRSSVIKPCPVCLLAIDPLSTWCLASFPDVMHEPGNEATWCHAHNQHFQCDFSSCVAMKQVCYVYIVMVTGAALPLKRVQCHWCCGEVLC